MRRPPGFTRRRFLAGTAGAAAVASAGRWWPADRATALDRTWRTVVDPDGTTLAATIVPSGAGPYRLLAEGPGEPINVRVDLAVPKAGREDRRTTLASFVHFTDQHLIDAQSPGRVEFLDPDDPLFQSAFRPQELLTTHVATSMVTAVAALGRGPVTGRTFDMVVCTGDNVDNQQRNEMEWFLTILDGGTITPDSGDLGTYEGVQDGVDVAARYWHPDAGIADDYKSNQGYPDVPGLLDRSLAPFTSPGLGIPWFSTYGNHDCNVQGNGRRTDAIDAIFVGDRKPVGLKPGESAFQFILRVFSDSDSVLADLDAGTIPFRQVSADARRQTATVHDWVQAHLASPTGHHGYGNADLAAGRLYYEFSVAPGVVGISLDTTNHAGGANGSGGSLGAGQVAWLEERLAAHHARYWGADGSPVRGTGDDQLVMVFSHHTAGTMDANDPDPDHPEERRILGPELAATLLRYPNVVAWVNGHTHTNGITAHRPTGGRTGGFFEVNTASHVDWPQQARVVELVDNHDGTLSIFGTMIEHAAPVTVDRSATDVLGLAAISRELGANDAQAGPEAKQGDLMARNVELVLAAPFVPAPAPPTTATTAGEPGPSVPASTGASPVSGAPAFTG
ncbi:MAG: uncharacterized protein JWM89_452 [Acidimicrobiales bacterium]|nr:uncharacterized protein [Acidimicrobiales bacterium]